MKTSKTVCFNLRSSWHQISRMYNSYATDHDITVSNAYVLLNLSRTKGTPSTQIAPLLGMEPSSLTRVLKNLEEKKLILKKADKNDLRQVNVFLTKKGEEKKEVARRTVKKFNDIVRKNLSEEEIESFLKTLNRISLIAEENSLTGLKSTNGQ